MKYITIALATAAILISSTSFAGECIALRTKDGSLVLDKRGQPVLFKYDQEGKLGCSTPKK